MTDEQAALIDFATSQRWFGAKTRQVSHAEVVDRAVLRDSDPTLELRIVELRFETGMHETYQLLTTQDSLDALSDPRQLRELVHMIRGGGRVPAEQGVVEFAAAGGFPDKGRELREARTVTAEQSNSSVVFDDELILKVFRRLDPGINPELELLRFLTERQFDNVAQLAGWYAYSGGPIDATLGILQQFVPGLDGWELALDTMVGDSAAFLGRLHSLGEVTGRMHAALGSDSDDPNFAPEQPSGESLALLTATVDEEIEQIFLELPSDNDELEPIRGRGEEVRERLRLLTNVGGLGLVIRLHGDFHLGQTLWASDHWTVIDFEGEPARPFSERRRKRSPLRDVAGMLRSFAYAASAAPLLRGAEPPQGWEEQARAEFLAGYRATVDPFLVPSGSAMDKLLAVFELEKAVYELRYELNNRPDWVRIPVAGIDRMLATEVPV